ncbi:hypothetical protein P691DRAFT_756971 [Macrolepiota fuliginosa MF-IS2]|uniref:Uncharacterized protein n=1 Tax=Macrolepiota fuliginosa MF-IS2 TaxID=1400762 RepID=A0A9P6C7Z7_9AGAR|nr:hypothetical protein P691DRAFT_756971 [Macrolepiota fuliginosa MF-IS2]
MARPTQRDHLPRLNIPPSLNAQQPIGGPGMFSPALPTALQHGFHPPFPIPNAMQTPMQPFFNPPPPPAPNRPTHHQGSASVAHLAAAGIHPPNGFPMTPIGGHFSRPSLMLAPGQLAPFPHRNRRQPSIGGPPKAVLGGPARKLSPIPPGASISPQPPAKGRKVTVNLPKETVPSEGEEPPTRPSWARTPIPTRPDEEEQKTESPELITRESYPPDAWRHMTPEVVDVFLPGKAGWDEMKQQAMEEKLEKLGVERGSGSNVPHIFAPHARAASMSSPDAHLLYLKLDRLQRSREASTTNSLSASPQPPFGLSPSSHRSTPGFVPRHGHAMSLAHPLPYLRSSPYEEGASTNPFGHDAILGNDQPQPPSPYLLEGAPPVQARSIFSVTAPPPPLSAVQPPDGRLDFIRGFGLDIHEEAEEEEEQEVQIDEESKQDESEVDATQDMEVDEDGERTHRSYSHNASPFPSKHHSRHASKLSGHLSLGSFGESNLAPSILHRNSIDGSSDIQNENEPSHAATDDGDAVGEWTGTDTSDDEQSIGEWSNPSDEERARRGRIERRLRRRAAKHNLDKPRRLPNFPRPPDNTSGSGLRSVSRQDDIVSNPSDEHLMLGHQAAPYLGVDPNYFSPARSSQVLPHSRSGSAPYSEHDPAQAHSRTPSDNFVYPGAQPHHQQQPSFGRRDLNPFAEPFVFGPPLATSSPVRTPNDSPAPHIRISSLGGGKPLNVSAPEFRPGGFTFRPPPGVPQMPSLQPPPSPPTLPVFPKPSESDADFDFTFGFPKSLPPPPREKDTKDALVLGNRDFAEGSPFALQGREKRQRRGSIGSLSMMDEGDSMASFKFPRDVDSPRGLGVGGHAGPGGMRRSTSYSGSRSLQQQHVLGHDLNPSAEPFTFAGFSAVAQLPVVPPATVDPKELGGGHYEQVIASPDAEVEVTLRGEVTGVKGAEPVEGEVEEEVEYSVPSSTTKKRAPIPLDFKNVPSSNNTVPAGLFKALANEERTRRSVRSRLSSREIFDHFRRPSMDDNDVPQIAHSRSHGKRMGAHGSRDNKGGSISDDDVFGTNHHHSRRRSSLPDNLGDLSSMSHGSIPPADLTSRMELHRVEHVIGELLDAKFAELRRMVISQVDVVAEEGQKEFADVVKHELKDILAGSASAGGNRGVDEQDVRGIMESVGNTVINAIQEAIHHTAPSREHDALADKLITALTPTLASLRAEPIDYDFLTTQLATQLTQQPAEVDTEALTGKLIAEVKRAIAPIDAFEIREQVADLVVERLDSRLAVRDKAFNVETITTKVNEAVAGLLEPSKSVPETIEKLAEVQEGFKAKQEELGVSVKSVKDVVEELPARFGTSLEGLLTGQKDVLARLDALTVPKEKDSDILEIKTLVGALAESQKDVINHNADVLAKVQALPETVTAATTTLQMALTDLIHSRDSANKEIEELRRSNTDYQVQLAKARGAHGQVRVEKDVMSEKLSEVEAERERLGIQVKDLEKASAKKAAETSTLEARNAELEAALSKALSRLQAADVASQANTDRIAELEKLNGEFTNVKGGLESKIMAMEMQVQLATRDKETVTHALQTLQKQHDELHSQQSHWADLRQASEKIDLLTNLIGQADNEELQELRRYREQSRSLEVEHGNLQKRFKEIGDKFVASEKNISVALQNLVQAQQRTTEWERRAKEVEGQLEATQTKLDQTEQTHAQLDTDYSLVKLQLEELEAGGRAAKDRETRMRETITALENKVRTMQTELEKKASAPSAPAPVPAPVPTPIPTSNYRHSATNGYTHNDPTRPDSRASTIYNNRSATPTRRISSYAASSVAGTTPPQPSVWDSMHAPRTSTITPVKYPTLSSVHAPTGRYPSSIGRGTPKTVASYRSSFTPARVASPAMSVVSNAPTLREDGWYE